MNRNEESSLPGITSMPSISRHARSRCGLSLCDRARPGDDVTVTVPASIEVCLSWETAIDRLAVRGSGSPGCDSGSGSESHQGPGHKAGLGDSDALSSLFCRRRLRHPFLCFVMRHENYIPV